MGNVMSVNTQYRRNVKKSIGGNRMHLIGIIKKTKSASHENEKRLG